MGENGDRVVQGDMSHFMASVLREKELGCLREEKHARFVFI